MLRYMARDTIKEEGLEGGAGRKKNSGIATLGCVFLGREDIKGKRGQ